jgi:hypothetical protein
MHSASSAARFLAALVWIAVGADAARGAAPLAGYADYAQFERQVKELDESGLVTARSLGRTLGGRDVWLLVVGTGSVDDKPAVLILGNVYAPQLAGSELAVRMVKLLIERQGESLVHQRVLDPAPHPRRLRGMLCFAAGRAFGEPAPHRRRSRRRAGRRPSRRPQRRRADHDDARGRSSRQVRRSSG